MKNRFSMYKLDELYSEKRIGNKKKLRNKNKNSHQIRSEYQRDYDRIIFSSPFRRLQNKTQVFPLPGSIFVHNRLTHSLEVSSVGRSLGHTIGCYIADNYKEHFKKKSSESFYKNELSNVISAACLCHDIGNPAFGHSGEDAISNFFINNEENLKRKFSKTEWQDLINFEGNANALRILKQGKGDGLDLTYSTLCAIAKYPCESLANKDNFTKDINRKKYCFFQSEKDLFIDIAKTTAMKRNLQTSYISYIRHPFVWLVEAADDICYNIIDLEDAHRLKIVGHKESCKILKELIKEIKLDKKKIKGQKDLSDNSYFSYLRAKAINSLTHKLATVYENNIDCILKGEFKISLYDKVKKECKSLKKIEEFCRENFYKNRKVVEIENAGYNVMNELLKHFIFPTIKEEIQRSKADKKALELLPQEYESKDSDSDYYKVMKVLDYVTGMTDNYATELYRRIKGIEIGMNI